MKFKPEEAIFHREECQAMMAEMRSKDYPLLVKKEVVGTAPLVHRRPNPYIKDGKALVSFVVAGKEIKNNIRQAVDLLGGFNKSLKTQDRILLKPNFNSDDPPPGSTALDFLAAVIDLLREHGYSHIVVGEGSGRPWVPSEKVFKNAGLLSRMAEMKVPLLDFDKSRFLNVPIAGEYLDLIAYPKDLESFDKIIYLPTMKTHYLAGFSMSLKLTVGMTHLVDRTILHGDNNMFVAQRAVEMSIPIKPDLIIMDVKLPGGSGIETTRQLTKRHARARVIFYTYHDDETYLEQAIQAGAKGYLLKSDPNQLLLAALRTVLAGEVFISPALAEKWTRLQQRPNNDDPIEALSSRERQVLQLVVSGQSNPLIAERLGISVRTVEVHRRNIMDKLGVKNAAGLIKFAVEHGVT